MSASPLKLVEPDVPEPPDQDSAPPEGRVNVRRLAGIAVVATVVLLGTLVAGIAIGSAARKRFERWSRGY